MEPSPITVNSTPTASDIALKSKKALLEAVEDVTYGSVRTRPNKNLVFLC